MRENILLKRKYLLTNEYKSETRIESLYFAAKLLNQFGILVDKPELITKHHVKLVSNLYGVNIPRGFYANPQDTRYFTTNELLIEHLVSYWQIGLNGVNHPNSELFDRVEVFKKVLPEYQEGKEVVFREYQVIDTDAAAIVLSEVADNLALYTRKWRESEALEF